MNMSYCRFENTYKDLVDCYNNMDNDLSFSELDYRKDLILICKRIIDEYEDLLDKEDNEFRTFNEAPYGDD